MKKQITFIPLLLLACVLLQPVYGSSGETEYIINGYGQHVCTRSLYANQYAPSSMGCAGGVDLVKGATFSPGAAGPGTSPILNGFPVSPSMLKAAKGSGVRGIIHHERQWAQHENVNTSNFFIDYYINEVDYANNTLTLTYYNNLPASCVRFSDTTISYTESALMKYEGTEGSEKFALNPTRHLRIYEPRPMVIYSFDPEAINPVREPHDYYNKLGWMRMGFFRGMKNGKTYFTEYRNGEWINTYAPSLIKDIDGYRAIPEGYKSVARPGDFIVTAPRMVGGELHNTSYGNVIPQDEGSVIGYIVEVNGDDVSVEVTKSPTGIDSDIHKDTVTVTIDNNAKFHHNGIKESSKSESLQKGNLVRILPAISNGMLLTRDAGSAGKRRQNLNYTPVLESAFLSNDPLEFTINDNTWQATDTVYSKENETFQIQKLVYGNGNTAICWYENGMPLTGSKETINVEGYQFITYSKKCSLSDHGNIYSASSKTLSGELTSDPVVLIVEPDQSAPGISSGSIDNETNIRITFNEEMHKNSVENTANYDINNGISVNDVHLTGDKQTVVITTSNLSLNNDYTITVNNVKDRAATPNEINSNAQITLSYTEDVSNKQVQTISFPSIEDVDLSESPLTLNASSSSGLTVSYQVLEGPASVTNDQLTLEDTGTVWIQAEQSGNSNYYSACPVQQKFYITSSTKLSQTISLESINDTLRVRSLPASRQINASASSGLGVNYEIVKGHDCEFMDNVLFMNDTGKVTIRVKQPGNYMYNPASPVEISFFLDTIRGDDYLNIPHYEEKKYLEKNENYTFSASLYNKYDEKCISQPSISWEVISKGSIQQDGTYTAPSTTGGPYYIVASASPGDDLMTDTAEVFVRKEQTITCHEFDSVYYKHDPFPLQCTASSGLTVEYEDNGGPIDIINGDTVKLLGIWGDAYIAVAQPGNDYYSPAPQKLLSFYVSKTEPDDIIIGLDDKMAENSGCSNKVYPNPVQDILHIKSCKKPVGEIVVRNMLGETVVQKRNVTQLDFSNFKAGLYFVEVQDKIYKIVKK